MPQAQTIHIPAGLPIDEATRNELQTAGQTNRGNFNVRTDARGALNKRLGAARLTRARLSDTDRVNGHQLFAHGGVPCIIHRPSTTDTMRIDSYVDAASTNVPQSIAPECGYRTYEQPVATQGFEATDVAYAGGFVATVVAPFVRATVCDAETGTIVFVQDLNSNGTATLASFSDRFIIAFVQNATTGIDAYLLDTQTITAGWFSFGSVTATSSTPMPASASMSNRVAVAYGTSSGTNRITVKTYSELGLLETRTVGTSSATPAKVDINGSIAGNLWVAGLFSTNTQVTGLDADNLAVTTATTASPSGGVGSGIGEVFIVEGPSSTARLIQCLVNPVNELIITPFSISGGAATAGTGYSVYSVGLMCRPWTRDGRFYAVAFGGGSDATFGLSEFNKTNVQRLCIVVDWTDLVGYWRPIASIEPGLVAPIEASKVAMVDADRFVFPLQTMRSGSQDLGSSLQGDSLSGLSIVELSFNVRQSVSEFANYTFLGGALTSVFDGRTVTESNFLVKPNKPETTLGATGITGTYRYVAIYEDVDAAGNWVVSGISDPSDVVTAVNEYVIVTVPPLTVSSRIPKGTVRVAIYRTANGGEAPYYRLGTILNDTTAIGLDLTDTTTDATLLRRSKLYAPSLPGTAGESLDRRAPPGLAHITPYNGMLVGASGENVYWSGQEVYGEAPWFSPVFQLPLTDGAEITALATQDGTLFIFKRDRIFAVAGEYPSDNGLSGGLGVPRLLASDVGCISAASVVVCSLGILFRSSRGIEILGRSQQVEFIGEPISATVDAYPVTTSAVLDERGSILRFSLAQAMASGVVTDAGGVDVVFDLTTKQWVSTDSRLSGEAIQSACMVRHAGDWRYASLDRNGYMFAERDEDDDSAYLDDDAWISSGYETAPLKVGLQSEQRVYEIELLFERYSPAGLTIQAANDYGAYSTDTPDKVWTDAELDGLRQVPFRPKARGMAIQLYIVDQPPADLSDVGNGRGFSFVGLSADVAAEQRFTRGTMRTGTGARK